MLTRPQLCTSCAKVSRWISPRGLKPQFLKCLRTVFILKLYISTGSQTSWVSLLCASDHARAPLFSRWVKPSSRLGEVSGEFGRWCISPKIIYDECWEVNTWLNHIIDTATPGIERNTKSPTGRLMSVLSLNAETSLYGCQKVQSSHGTCVIG